MECYAQNDVIRIAEAYIEADQYYETNSFGGNFQAVQYVWVTGYELNKALQLFHGQQRR